MFVTLSVLTYKDTSVEEILRDELRNSGFPEFFFDEAAKNGCLLLLVDAVDEAPPEKATKVIQEINELQRKFDKCRIITSCRTAFYSRFFHQFTDVRLTSFNDNQIKNFIYNWFNNPLDAKAGMSSRLENILYSPSHISTLELARTPLLLTFICAVMHGKNDLPTSRTELYKWALDILMREWSAQKRVHGEPFYKTKGVTMDEGMKKIIISEVAASFYEKGKVFF